MKSKKMFEIYKEAILNEKSIDDDFAEFANFSFIFSSPRLIRYKHFADKNKAILKIIIIIIILSWPLLFSIIATKRLIRLIIKRNNGFTKSILLKSPNSVLLFFSNKLIDLFIKNFPDKDYSILYMSPQIKQKAEGLNLNSHCKNIINLNDLLTMKTIFISCLQTFVYAFRFSFQYPSSILQTYVTMEIVILMNILKDYNYHFHNKNVYFSNHYDRFAIVFDRLIESKQKNLLQHGILKESFYPEYKLNNIDNLWSINSSHVPIWKRNILNSSTSFHYLNNKIKLTQMSDDINKTILIVNNPRYTEEEKKLITLINESLPFLTIFYKLHPTIKDKKICCKNIHLIREQVFPKALIVIYKESTLGLEYNELGVETIILKNINYVMRSLRKRFY
jgi:hypothetical protein